MILRLIVSPIMMVLMVLFAIMSVIAWIWDGKKKTMYIGS
jgi:hypothetical protein